VAQACNSRYSEVGDLEVYGNRTVQAKSSNTHSQQMAGHGVIHLSSQLHVETQIGSIEQKARPYLNKQTNKQTRKVWQHGSSDTVPI
jgi:hypothetical protein